MSASLASTGVIRHPAVGQYKVEVLFAGHLENLSNLAVEGGIAGIVHMGVADDDKRPVGRVSHGAVALVGHIPGHAGGQHIPFAAVLGYGDTLAAERRVEVFILPARYFFLCRQKVGGQLQRDNAAVVGVHIQIGVTAAYGNVKITDLIAEGVVWCCLTLYGPAKASACKTVKSRLRCRSA